MNKVLYILLFATWVWGISSCEFETSNNGKLDGMWHLEQIDTLQTKGVKDMRAERLFWSFQGKLLVTNDVTNQYAECVMEFEKKHNQLVLSKPLLSDRTKGDPFITNVKVIAPYGINQLGEVFEIEVLHQSEFVIKSKQIRLHFVKF